jgi:type IV secretory pathway VirD2 relaxase
MDYLKAQYPPKFIRALFNLTDKQINTALSYIEANRVEVEAEYQEVLKEAEELRQYYEEQNRELVEKIAKMPPPPGREAAWEKLQAQKAKLKAKLESQV